MKRKKSVPYEEGLMERLKDPEYAAEYLMGCLEDQEGDPEELFLLALRDVAKAHGFSAISKKSKLGRESLYKAISKKGNPKLSTVVAVLEAMDLELSIQPKKAA